MPSREEFMERFKGESAGPTRTFEGFSEFSDDTDETAFHRAMKKAAKAAADAAIAAANEGVGEEDQRTIPDPEWFEVARVRILVGNPNIKVLGVTITATDSGG
jgi:hypothetical protein